jgi:hypothetical protein
MGRRDPGDQTGAGCPVVRGVDVEADDGLAGPGVQGCPDRAQRLGEHDRGTPVQQAVGLGVALHRHRGDQSLR